MEKNRLHILENEPVYKAITKLALPMVLGMIVQILYNITDTFFIGKLNDPNQLAAVSLTMPLFMLLMAVSGILGNGGASYLSRVLGQKDIKLAEKTAAIAFYSCVFLAILLLGPCLIFLKPLIRMLGTSANTFQYAYQYSFIIIVCGVIVMSNFALGQLLRAEGAAKEAMFGMLIGTIVNIVLDPVFIFAFKMGVTGAAVATVLGNFAGLIYYMTYYYSKKSMFSLAFKNYTFDKKIYWQIIMIGIPASLNQILMSVASVISNNIAAGYGDITVAAVGVAMRITTIAIFIMIGVAIGCQPLIGYNYGAQRIARLEEVIKKAMTINTAIGLFFAILFLSFSKYLIVIFSTNEEVIDTGMIILNAMTFSLPFVGIQMVIGNAVQAMGKALPSLFLSIARQGIVYIPAIIILNHLFGFYGFIYAQVITDTIIVVIAFIVFLKIMARLKADHKENRPITAALELGTEN